MKKDRIVIDTNVILSRAINPTGTAAQAFDQAIENQAIENYDFLQSKATA